MLKKRFNYDAKKSNLLKKKTYLLYLIFEMKVLQIQNPSHLFQYPPWIKTSLTMFIESWYPSKKKEDNKIFTIPSWTL